MAALRLVPVVLALAVLAAHFYRSGELAGVAVAAVLVALLFVRRPWAAWTVQAGLALGAIEWLRTMAGLIALRESMGAPYLRLALILGVVALLTAACVLVFRSRAVRAHFGLPPRAVTPSASDAA